MPNSPSSARTQAGSGGFAWAHKPVSVIRCSTLTSDSRSHTGKEPSA